MCAWGNEGESVSENLRKGKSCGYNQASREISRCITRAARFATTVLLLLCSYSLVEYPIAPFHRMARVESVATRFPRENIHRTSRRAVKVREQTSLFSKQKSGIARAVIVTSLMASFSGRGKALGYGSDLVIVVAVAYSFVFRCYSLLLGV